MKKLFLTLSFLIVMVLSLNFLKEDTTNKSSFKNCTRPVAIIATVPTLEESRYAIKVPFVGNSYVGFKNAIGFKESRNRYHTVNSFGYLGKYQFGKSTLKRLKIYNTVNFLKNSKQQETAFNALCAINKHILRKDIKRSVGKKINGVLITESGILAAAHLGGAGNVKKFLRSRGVTNKSDAYGSSVKHYMQKFSGFDVSAIKANKRPVI